MSDIHAAMTIDIGAYDTTPEQRRLARLVVTRHHGNDPAARDETMQMLGLVET